MRGLLIKRVRINCAARLRSLEFVPYSELRYRVML